MPINRSRADKARQLINLRQMIPEARQRADDARADAANATAENYPPEMIEAFRILADEAEANVAETESQYEQVRQELVNDRGQAPTLTKRTTLTIVAMRITAVMAAIAQVRRTIFRV